ncbi:MAG: DUF5615 family PIN-like protein [Gemmatimonadaceae bacterium]
MIFFFDENMPPKVAAALQTLGTCEARHLVDYLPRGTADEEIFQFVAAKGWLLLTQDIRIRRNPHQREALKASGIGSFFLTGRAERSVEQMMVLLLDRLPLIKAYAETHRPPYTVSIPDRGQLEELD